MELTKKRIAEIRKRIEKQDSVFSQKNYLDIMTLPSAVIGREKESESLLRHILDLKDGFVVPFVSVYGRSGSGKSTLVRFVCENLGDIVSYRFVNLRKAKTVFGCANMILSGFGAEPLKSAAGLNGAIDCMQHNIECILGKEQRRFFVLVLDEYDVIFSDTRSNPSDFVYKLLQMEENLREKGFWVCIVTIANNALEDHDLDDRVKSRMGSAGVSFLPYSQSDVLEILRDRSKKAFSIPVSNDVLRHCASLASADHGDARRAIDLLRTAGEVCNGGSITRDDVDRAQVYLQKDRTREVVEGATVHTRYVAGAVCILAEESEHPWCATSAIYKKYSDVISKKGTNPLTSRRVSDLLVELENAGLLVSRDYSRGRNGYGKEYKLKVSPDVVAPYISKEFYESLIDKRARRNYMKKMQKLQKSNPFRGARLGGFSMYDF